jgi:hypothetical protein
MILGLSTFGLVHTILSFVALVTGIVVLIGLLTARSFAALTGLFLASAVATSATGFGFPGGLSIAKYLGCAALVVLLAAILARYVFHLAGAWRAIYAVAAVLSLYSLIFFTIGEAFLRLPPLHELAPTLTERPFVIAQLIAGALFVALAIAAAVRFRDRPVAEPRRLR